MNSKLETLKTKLAAIDTTYARYWDATCESALTAAITQNVTSRNLRGPDTFTRPTVEKIGATNLSGRQVVLLGDLVEINEKLNAGKSIKEEINVISDGQIKEREL
jgi:hypothetical protein